MEMLAGASVESGPFAASAPAPSNISLSDIVSALSFALDLTDGALPGHALRTCLLGMKIAGALKLSTAEQSDLYYALLLKDVGCSSNAARLKEIVGERELWRRALSYKDWTRLCLPALSHRWSEWAAGASHLDHLRQTLQQRVRLSQQLERSLAETIALRAERGASIAGQIGLSQETIQSIRHLDEHWDGSGYPGRLRGTAIPLCARIASIAQHLDVFSTERGHKAAIAALKSRSGSWFDPRLVKIALALHRRRELWACSAAGDDRDRVLALDPGLCARATMVQIDNVCEAFASVVDAKSSFTYEHSLGVTRTATMIAQQLGLDPDGQRLVYRAALLHDIGKLRVPNSILDKPGKLDAREWQVIREHPELTQRILERIARFDLIARTASQHHERLDGSGYPQGLHAEQLSTESRVIAVADVYGALSEDRPYRTALGDDEIMSIMSKDVPEKLDPVCFEALRRALKRTGGVVRCANGQLLSSGGLFASRARPAFIHAS